MDRISFSFLNFAELRTKLVKALAAIPEEVERHPTLSPDPLEVEEDPDDCDELPASMGGPLAGIIQDAPTPRPARSRQIDDPPQHQGMPNRAAVAQPSTLEPSEAGVDSRGLPWDKRIHSDPPTKKTDGNWRSRRGVTPEVTKAVEAELKDRFQSKPYVPPMPGSWAPGPVASVLADIPWKPVGFPQAEAPPVPFTPQFVPPAPVSASPPNPFHAPGPVASPTMANIPRQDQSPNFGQPAGGPVAAPQAPLGQPVASSPSIVPAYDLASFRANGYMVIANLISENKLDQPYLEVLCAHWKVAQIWEVLKDDRKCSEFFEGLCAEGLITKVG